MDNDQPTKLSVKLPPADATNLNGLKMSTPIITSPRRANCLPKQMIDSHFPAVSLSPKTGIPRRYDETKPVQIQNFTHRRIIGIGELINQHAYAEAEKTKKIAVERAIEETWDSAHAIKQQALADSAEKAALAQERAVKKVIKMKDRAIREEALKVESAMQEKMREAVEEEKRLAAEKLTGQIEQLVEKCEKELNQAVRDAREEEQRQAALERTKMHEDFEQKIAEKIEELTLQKEIELHDLSHRKDLEREVAVTEEREDQQKIAEDRLEAQQKVHAEEVKAVERQRDEIHHIIAEKEAEIQAIQEKREALYDELVLVQADYQEFVDNHPLFDPGQTGYLLPDFNVTADIVCPHKKS